MGTCSSIFAAGPQCLLLQAHASLCWQAIND